MKGLFQCPPWARSFWAFSPYLNHMRKFNQLFACFRKCFENILPFSEIIFVLLQADLHDLNGVQTLANQIWKP